MVKNNNKRKIFIIFTVLIFLLVGITTLSQSTNSVQAGLDACSNMGASMNRNPVDKNVINKDKSNRKWNVQELFTNSVSFTTYYGEGEGTWLYSDKVDRGLDRVGSEMWNDTDVQEKLKASREGCMASGALSTPSNLFISISNSLVKVTSKSLNNVLGTEDLIIEPLVKIIGGEGNSDDGLIGVFLNSLYMPLILLAALLLAGTVIYKGLVQGKLREAFMDVVWSFAAIIVGLVLMYNPQALARAPQVFTTQISTCMLGALSGQNCLTGTVTTPSLLTGKECASSISGDMNSSDMMVNGMNCTIWKSFVLELWAEEQFGDEYRNLYTYDPPPGGSIWKALPEGKGEDYCISMGSAKALTEQTGSNLIIDEGDKVCNVALYQLYLKTEMTDNVNHNKDPYKLSKSPSGEGSLYDARWFDIIVPMAKQPSEWTNWTGNYSFLGRLGSSLMGLLATFLAASVLFTFSILGAVYKITGLVLMAFAPMFLLFAVEPSRGRKIFLGWVETIISSILKYFAITMLIIVSLIMYSAILTNTSGGYSFIAVIVLTVTLFMYRKEVVDLIGATNMGGQKMANKVSGGYDKAKKGVGRLTKAGIGGAVGANWATRVQMKDRLNARQNTVANLRESISSASSPEEAAIFQTMLNEEEAKITQEKKVTSRVSERLKGTTSGAKDSTERILKRGTSTTAAMFSQKGRTEKELEKQEAERIKGLEEREKVLRENSQVVKPAEMENDSNNDNNNTPNIDGNVTVANQKEKVEYKGNLSPEEVVALDNFAAKIAGVNTENLLNQANDPATMLDPNKKALVAEEINARVKVHSLKGEPSGDLSRHELTDARNLTSEELEFNIDFTKDKYLESGNESDLKVYENQVNTKLERDPTLDRKMETLVDGAKVKREQIEKGLEIHERTSPTESELKENPEKYGFGKDEKLTTPIELKKKEEQRNESTRTNETQQTSQRNESPRTNETPQSNQRNESPRTNETQQTNQRNESPRTKETPQSNQRNESPRTNETQQTNQRNESPRTNETQQTNQRNESPKVNETQQSGRGNRESKLSDNLNQNINKNLSDNNLRRDIDRASSNFEDNIPKLPDLDD